MGSFPGHALPGSFFIVYAVWWAVNIFYYYNKSRWTGQTYTSRFNYMIYIKHGRSRVIPLESIMKVVFAVIGCLGEFIWSLKYDFGVPAGNAQHITMFAFFGISGICDLFIHYKGKYLPPNVDYAAGIVAFLVEALLFHFHLHGRSTLDIVIHTLLVYTILSNAALIGLEAIAVNNPLVSLVKAFSVLVQGTWFWQIGFILYSPFRTSSPWHHEDHEHVLFAVMLYAWHIGANIIIMITIGSIVFFVQSRLFYETSGYRAVDMNESQFSRTMFLGKDGDDETDESDSS